MIPQKEGRASKTKQKPPPLAELKGWKCNCKLLQLHSPLLLFALSDHLKWLPSLITSELFHFIEQWSDYYEDDGEEATHIHDTYKYYFPENYNDEEYGYVPSCNYSKFKNN